MEDYTVTVWYEQDGESFRKDMLTAAENANAAVREVLNYFPADVWQVSVKIGV